MKRNMKTQIIASVAALAFWLASLGCGEKAAEITPAEDTYTVRGTLVELPAPGAAKPEILIEHVAIDNFRNAQGEVVGMNSMVMPFPPAPGLSLEGLKVDDPVEFTFEMRWKAQPRIQLTKIAPLPPGTVLEFGKAQPNKPAAAADQVAENISTPAAAATPAP